MSPRRTPLRRIAALATAVAATVVLAGASGAQAAVPRTVTALTISGNGPFDIRRSGKLTGFDIQLVEQAARLAGVRTVQWRVVDFDDLLNGIQAGEAMMGAASITITSRRARVVTFGAPYLRASMGIVTRSGTTGVYRKADLIGSTIGVLQGSTAVAVARSVRGSRVRQYPTMQGAYRALLDAKVDSVINDYGQSKWYVQNNRPKFRYAGAIVVNQRYGLAFNKDEDELRIAMNTALRKMQRNGQYRRLLQRWDLDTVRTP